MIRKAYRRDDLIDTRAGVARRCAAIEAFTRIHGPQTHFSLDGGHLVRHTHRLAASTLADAPDADTLGRLAGILDAAHQSGLVHGDVRPKNVRCRDEEVWLCDWEPALRQVIGGQARLMASPPCLHSADRRDGRLTRLSDLMGLALLHAGVSPATADALASRTLRAGARRAAQRLAGVLRSGTGARLSPVTTDGP